MSGTWLTVIAIVMVLFVGNAALAYRYRSRKLRSEGNEPPSFLVYLFFPKASSFKEPVPFPRPLRALVGAVVFIGGAFFVLTGGLILFNLDFSKITHPAGAVIGLLALALVGVGIAYVGIRLIVMKNDEPMFGRKRGETKSSHIGAA